MAFNATVFPPLQRRSFHLLSSTRISRLHGTAGVPRALGSLISRPCCGSASVWRGTLKFSRCSLIMTVSRRETARTLFHPPVRGGQRLGALKNLPAFLGLVWRTNRLFTLASLVLRLVRALLPILTLYIGKLIIDEVVALVGLPGKPATLSAWLSSGGLLASKLALLLALEFALAVVADLLGRVVAMIDALLSERLTNHLAST